MTIEQVNLLPRIALQDDYITGETSCQGYQEYINAVTDKDIEELCTVDTVDTFTERYKLRKEYESLVLPHLKDGRKAAWKQCCSQVWIKGNGTVSGLMRCHNRLCLICNWREARANFAEVKQIVSQAEQEGRHKYIFATFTIRNCNKGELSNTIDELMQAVNRLQSNKAWKSRVIGYIRHMEITVSADGNTFHPHYHYILMMPEDYYVNSSLYLTRDEWRHKWCKAAHIVNEDENQCYIKAVSDKNLDNTIAEVSKYAIKMAEGIRTQSNDIIRELIQSLRRRRLQAYGGLIKEIAQNIKKSRKYYNPFDEIPEGTPYIRDDGTDTYRYATELEKLKHVNVSVNTKTGEIYSREQLNAWTDREKAKMNWYITHQKQTGKKVNLDDLDNYWAELENKKKEDLTKPTKAYIALMEEFKAQNIEN